MSGDHYNLSLISDNIFVLISAELEFFSLYKDFITNPTEDNIEKIIKKFEEIDGNMMKVKEITVKMMQEFDE